MYLYVAQFDDYDIYKIGITNSLYNRLSHLQANSPKQITIIAYIENDFCGTIEQQIHFNLSPFWLRGEWFECSLNTIIKELEVFGKVSLCEIKAVESSNIKPIDQAIELLSKHPEYYKMTTRQLEEKTGINKNVWSRAKQK